MAASGLVSRNDLVGTGRAISVLFGVNWVRNRASISSVQGPFFFGKLAFLKRLN